VCRNVGDVFVIDADTGELYSFGCNDEGQLGCDSGSEERVDVPTKVTLPTEDTCIRMLSAGVYHSACLTGIMPVQLLYSCACIVYVLYVTYNNFILEGCMLVKFVHLLVEVRQAPLMSHSEIIDFLHVSVTFMFVFILPHCLISSILCYVHLSHFSKVYLLILYITSSQFFRLLAFLLRKLINPSKENLI